jgi:hypothetical protein
MEKGKRYFVEYGNLSNEEKEKINKWKKIHFSDEYNDSIDFLSDNVNYIRLSNSFNQPINRLPANLKVLIIDSFSKFNYQLLDILPDSLEVLELNIYYNQDIPLLLPNLRKITYCKCYGLDKQDLLEDNPNMNIIDYELPDFLRQ